jgi:FMN phosphatase YigB (HAD superfamily)
MFEYNGKKYKVIIWDWLYTLYNPDTAVLYRWVDTLLPQIPTDVTHYLVSFAKHPELRLKKIQDSEIAKYLKKIVIDTENKTDAFAALLKEENLTPNEVLVIGDNPSHEGQAASASGFDYIHVWKFAESLGYIHE